MIGERARERGARARLRVRASMRAGLCELFCRKTGYVYLFSGSPCLGGTLEGVGAWAPVASYSSLIVTVRTDTKGVSLKPSGFFFTVRSYSYETSWNGSW